MTIVGMDTVVYGVDDLKAARSFFGDWGLNKVGAARNSVTFETRQGTQVVAKPKELRDLPTAAENGPTVREVIWGVKTKRDLARVGKALSADQEIREDKDGTIHGVDPNGFGVGFRLWRGKTLKPSQQKPNTPGERRRVSKVGNFHDRAQPSRLGHVVFNVPHFEACERFYTDRLGFVVSDRIRDNAVYLRCDVESDHHNLFFLKTPAPRPAFNHLAFEVCDIHELFGGGMFLKDHGWKTQVGPGRHPASSAYFWYFDNPCGGAAEYFADSDWLDAKWKPRVFEPRPSHFAEWLVGDGIERFQGF